MLCFGQAKAQKMFAPVHGYISVETFEIRKEFVMRLDTVAQRLGIDVAEDGGVVSAERRVQIEQKLGEWLKGKCPLKVDGRPVEMALDRVHFVRSDPALGMVVEDRETVPASEALLGVVFAAALGEPAGEVAVKWEVFPADGSAAIVAIGTRENTVTHKVTAEAPEIAWQSKGELAVPELLDLPPPPLHEGLAIPLVSVLAGLLAVVLIGSAIRLGDKTPPWLGVGVVVLIVLAVLARGQMKMGLSASSVEITPELADEVVYALLRNTYRAFDYRKESDVYDVLAQSVDGELLTKVYLEVQKSLELESQGGARARVYELDLRKCELNDAGEEGVRGFEAKCSWVAIGTVTHWGHTHDRVNRYEAQLSVGVIDGKWKLQALELLNQERTEQRVGQR
jgi:hypothetical protein